MTMSEPQNITIEEITTKCLEPLGAALIECLSLKKQAASQDSLVKQMAKNEAELMEHIAELTGHIQVLEAELERLRPPPLSEAELAIADGARTVIRGE